MAFLNISRRGFHLRPSYYEHSPQRLSHLLHLLFYLWIVICNNIRLCERPRTYIIGSYYLNRQSCFHRHTIGLSLRLQVWSFYLWFMAWIVHRKFVQGYNNFPFSYADRLVISGALGQHSNGKGKLHSRSRRHKRPWTRATHFLRETGRAVAFHCMMLSVYLLIHFSQKNSTFIHINLCAANYR